METNRQSNNLLSSSTVPNLQPPPPPPPIQSSSSASTSASTSNWFNSHHHMNSSFDQNTDSDNDHTDHHHHHHHQYTPSPKRRVIHQGFNDVSTPLNYGNHHPSSSNTNNISFSSPMNKLNDLHLNDSDILLSDEQIHKPINNDNIILEEDEIEDDDENYDSYDNNHDNNDHIDDIQPNSDISLIPAAAPKYINIRKRHHVETPISNSSSLSSIPNHNHTAMSICTDDTSMENHNNLHSQSNQNSKLSFITSDSTPCPPQPKRKKLKFKSSSSTNTNEKKSILNLSNSRKTSINNHPQIQINNQDIDDDEDDENDSEIEDLKSAAIPISQSTPSNSRASTPPLQQSQSQSQSQPQLQPQPQPQQQNSIKSKDQMFEEYGDSINGFKFVKSTKSTTTTTTTQTKYKYNYETPINNNRYYYNYQPPSTELKPQPQPKGKYQIVGEFPTTSAGMMNESDEDVHIGDKRINDPYLKPIMSITTTPYNDQWHKIKQCYVGEDENKRYLPLSLPYFYTQFTMTTSELLTIINDSHTVENFYKSLLEYDDEGGLIALLRRERIKWHPDKWMSSHHMKYHFDGDVLNGLSKVINSLINGLE
ncbi:hypothetical protein DFJ63DRAFT_71249 [Scheffersomyces coipomensis]|uniref:uncharacterized protein n=1 Tax=Scheffersomyces coipomensis TaxID=1788519 RepID=UPI00315D93E1